jgi:hypothetical protein
VEIALGDEKSNVGFSFSKQHQVRAWCLTVFMIRLVLPVLQVCVRRGVVLSVMANPNCKDKGSAERAVNEVWESCNTAV